MTQAPAGAAPAAHRWTAWRLLTLAAAAAIFLIYSQFWVFPLLGDAGNPAASGLVRALYLPAYGAALLLFALSPGATLGALARQPFLVLLLLIAALSAACRLRPTRPCDGPSPSASPPWAPCCSRFAIAGAN